MFFSLLLERTMIKSGCSSSNALMFVREILLVVYAHLDGAHQH